MRYKRGNVDKELEYMEQSMLVELELRDITVGDLKRMLEKIGTHKKPVPKIGRPVLSIKVKLKRKLVWELKLGILDLFH